MPRCRIRALLLLLCWCGATPPWDGSSTSRSLVQAAEVLSAGDAEWLALLQPASRSGLPLWMEVQEELAKEVAEAKASGGLDYVAYGDSIMEAFRGTSMGQPQLMPSSMGGGEPADAYAASKTAWEQAFAGKRAGVFGISGDQSVHLHWRLKHGEGPHGLDPKTVAVMIGTNDAGHLSSIYKDDPETAGHIIALGVQQNVWELQRQAPAATLVVFGLLPLQPSMLGGPVRSFDGIIKAANAEIQAFVDKQASPTLKFKDCGPGFLLPDGSVDATLIPDGVHPAGPGAEVLLKCMLEAMGL